MLEHAQRSFVSSTYWTERIGPAAALATLRRHRANSVGTRLMAVGAAVQAGWRAAAEEVGLAVRIHGIAPLSHLRFVEQPQPSVTLFTQLMLDRGFLAGGSFYPSFAHQDEHVEQYLAAVAHRLRRDPRGPGRRTGAGRPARTGGAHRLHPPDLTVGSTVVTVVRAATPISATR